MMRFTAPTVSTAPTTAAAVMPVPEVAVNSTHDSTRDWSRHSLHHLSAPAESVIAQRAVTLGELQDMALVNNPAIAEARAHIEAARGEWVQVGLRPNPMLGYAGEEIGNEGSAGLQGGWVQQQIITAGKLGLNRSVAARQVEVAQHHLAAQQFRVANDVAIAFYRALLAERRSELARRLVTIAEDAANTAARLLTAQEGDRVSLLQARTEQQTALLLQTQAENTQSASWRQLAAVVGIRELPHTPLVGDLEAPIVNVDWESARDQLLSASPLMAAANAEVDRAQWALSRALAGRYPDVQANANVLYDDGTSDTTAGVQLGVPLQVFNRNQGNIRQARGELSAARQALKRLELNLTSQLADVVRRHANARQQVVRYGDHIVPNAREALELTQQGYEEGEFNYLVVLIAQVTYTRANLAYLAALGEAWEAKIEIDGMLLTGSLNGGVGAKGTNTTAPLGSGPGPLFLPWK